jgi:hypothetical protein
VNTAAERNAAMARIAEVQRKMVEELTRGLQTDPASLDRKRDDFGCGLLQVYPGNGGSVEASFTCGMNFNGGVLNVTGTMTRVR